MSQSPLMQYVTEYKQLRDYLNIAYRRLEVPLSTYMSDKDVEVVANAWKKGIIRRCEDMFENIKRGNNKNSQDIYDALEALRTIKREVVAVLEKDIKR